MEVDRVPYWRMESPTSATTRRVLVQFYPKARRLRVTHLFPHSETGALTPGKGVTLAEDDLRRFPKALDLLLEVLSSWR